MIFFIHTYIKRDRTANVRPHFFPFYSVGIEPIVNTGTVEWCKVNTFSFINKVFPQKVFYFIYENL